MRLIDADGLIALINNKQFEIVKLRACYRFLSDEEKEKYDVLEEFKRMVEMMETEEERC